MPDTRATDGISNPLVPLRVRWLGRIPYPESWQLQKELFADRLADRIPDTLLLLEHPHVLTLGRVSREEHILVPADVLAQRGVSVERIDRGGEVTYHGPGQLVAYPIIKLEGQERHLDRLVWQLEETIIATLRQFGLTGIRSDDRAQHGIWVRGGKICSIGMTVRRWIVTHGLALNVDPDLAYFELINPCGHPGAAITSMADLLSIRESAQSRQRERLTPLDVAPILLAHFCRIFDRRIIDMPAIMQSQDQI